MIMTIWDAMLLGVMTYFLLGAFIGLGYSIDPGIRKKTTVKARVIALIMVIMFWPASLVDMYK